jgi:hypothetical protein
MFYKRLRTSPIERRIRGDVRPMQLPVIGDSEVQQLVQNHTLLEPLRPLEQVCSKTQPAGR